MDVDRLMLQERRAPRRFEQALPAEDPTRLLGQDRQQIELSPRQVHNGATDRAAARPPIELDVAHAQESIGRGGVPLRAPQLRPDPSDHLGRRERLDDVIVCPTERPATRSVSSPRAVSRMIGTLEIILILRTSSNPSIPGSITSITATSMLSRRTSDKASCPPVGLDDRQALPLQVQTQQIAQRTLVIDDQDTRCAGHAPDSRRANRVTALTLPCDNRPRLPWGPLHVRPPRS